MDAGLESSRKWANLAHSLLEKINLSKEIYKRRKIDQNIFILFGQFYFVFAFILFGLSFVKPSQRSWSTLYHL